MKLYATTTSERASKGQGGNKHILNVLTAEIGGERQEIMSMDCVYSIQGDYHWSIKTPEGKQLLGIIKGNNQKGEKTELDRLISSSDGINSYTREF